MSTAALPERDGATLRDGEELRVGEALRAAEPPPEDEEDWPTRATAFLAACARAALASARAWARAAASGSTGLLHQPSLALALLTLELRHLALLAPQRFLALVQLTEHLRLGACGLGDQLLLALAVLRQLRLLSGDLGAVARHLLEDLAVLRADLAHQVQTVDELGEGLRAEEGFQVRRAAVTVDAAHSFVQTLAGDLEVLLRAFQAGLVLGDRLVGLLELVAGVVVLLDRHLEVVVQPVYLRSQLLRFLLGLGDSRGAGDGHGREGQKEEESEEKGGKDAEQRSLGRVADRGLPW